MSAGRLLASYVVDVSSRDAETAGFGREAAGAGAVRLDGGEVVRVGAVAEVDGAGGGNGVAETLRFGGCSVRTWFFLVFYGRWGEEHYLDITWNRV